MWYIYMYMSLYAGSAPDMVLDAIISSRQLHYKQLLTDVLFQSSDPNNPSSPSSPRHSLSSSSANSLKNRAKLREQNSNYSVTLLNNLRMRVMDPFLLFSDCYLETVKKLTNDPKNPSHPNSASSPSRDPSLKKVEAKAIRGLNECAFNMFQG